LFILLNKDQTVDESGCTGSASEDLLDSLFQLYDKELIKEKRFSGITLFIAPL